MTRAPHPHDDDMRVGRPQLHRVNHPTSTQRQLQHGLFQFEWRLYRDREIYVVASERALEDAQPTAHIWQFHIEANARCLAALELVERWFGERADQFGKEVTAPWTT